MGTQRRNKKGQFISAAKNKWTIKGDVARCHSNGRILFFTDAQYADLLKMYNWFPYANGYCGTRIMGNVVGVHQFLMGIPKGALIDHINRNKKDNRLCNLRVADKSLNAFNTGIRKNNSSGATGVRYRKDTKRWTAEIKKNYKKISLGCYETKEEAIQARRKAERELYGDK